MAYSSSKARLFNELARSRNSSPHADDYATAGSFDVRSDQIINSTMQIPDNTTQQQLPQQQMPLHYDQHPESEGSEHGSDGSADMSIELGRGVKRGARDVHEDVSSNIIFNLGNDSQYEVTATPPIRPRTSARKSNDALRRDASIRRATEAAKAMVAAQRTTSGSKHRTLSETLAQVDAESDVSLNAEILTQPTATSNNRNTRFTRSRQVSANVPAMPSRFVASQSRDGTPRRAAANNPTVQSATFTANSFMLPDLPNITELVSGVRKDGTPVFNRTTKPRSRFTSGSHKPRQGDHAPVESVPIPEEEKAIFASLQLLKDKVAELEMAKSEAQKRAEEYEDEIIDLRSQLQTERRRPDSALGSDDESRAVERRRMEQTRLHASVKALQDRLDRSERKVSVSDIAVRRVTKERDELVRQIGVAYFNNEELKAENETFRDSHNKLQAENEDLKDELEAARRENQELRLQLAQTPGLRAEAKRPEKQEAPIRSRKEGQKSRAAERDARRTSSTLVERETEEDIASKIAREVQKHRDEALAAQRLARNNGEDEREEAHQAIIRTRQRQASAGPERQTSVKKGSSSTHDEGQTRKALSMDQSELPQGMRDTLKAVPMPSSANSKQQDDEDDDSREITYLSAINTDELDRLRRKIEEEHRARREKRNTSAPAKAHQEETVRSASLGMPRKSSLKDITAGFGEGTGRFSLHGDDAEDTTKAAKSVRVQSPHISEDPSQQALTEAGDLSILSNTSRRRRRAASAEGMTSAFILPDITLHSSQPLPTAIGKTCIQHNTSSCTACHPNSKDIAISTPVPATDREVTQDVDITTATIRPSQPPPLALATVIKQVEDEIVHLKLQLQAQQDLYNKHDPALSKRKRALVKSRMERLTAEIEKRSDQVYALYDVLEGQKQTAAQVDGAGETTPGEMREEEVEETLMSIGIDPAELAGRIGRSAPSMGLDGAEDLITGDGTEELAWEGLSDYESEEDRIAAPEKRRSAAI